MPYHGRCQSQEVGSYGKRTRHWSILVGCFVLLFALLVGAPAATLAATPKGSSEPEKPVKMCVDNYNTKKVTCATTRQEAELSAGVSAQVDFIAFVLWSGWDNTGSGYYLWNYPCWGDSTSWNNLIDFNEQTHSAQPIQCTNIELYAAFNVYYYPDQPHVCWSNQSNVTHPYVRDDVSSFFVRPYRGFAWCGIS